MKSLKLFGLGMLFALTCTLAHAMESFTHENGAHENGTHENGTHEDGAVNTNFFVLDVALPAALGYVSPYAYYPYCFGRTYQKDGAREALRFAARETATAGMVCYLKYVAKEATGKNDLWECPSKKDRPIAHATCASARYFLREIVLPMTVQACIVNPLVDAALPPKHS